MGLDHFHNDNPPQGGSQTPRFDWPKLRKALEFYENERLCYLPAGWGHKSPSVKWEEFQACLPALWEKAQWFQEDKPSNIGVRCGAASCGLVALCFNDPKGAAEFFGEERWQKLLQATDQDWRQIFEVWGLKVLTFGDGNYELEVNIPVQIETRTPWYSGRNLHNSLTLHLTGVSHNSKRNIHFYAKHK